MNSRRGSVWYGSRRVGRLDEDRPGRLRFAYDADWLSDGGFAVSLSLPREVGTAGQEATGYFEGLLPEGAVRQRIARRFGVAPDAGRRGCRHQSADQAFAFAGCCYRAE